MARNIAAVALVFGLLAAATTAGAQARTDGRQAQGDAPAKHNFRLFPQVGTTATTFRATFKAPFRTDGNRSDYTLEAVGPRPCASLFEFTTAPTRRGQRVVLELTPFDDLYFGFRRRWCPGGYVGYVFYSAPGLQPDRLIGYFSFGVERAPVNLAP
jgi:hypothetical protein